MKVSIESNSRNSLDRQAVAFSEALMKNYKVELAGLSHCTDLESSRTTRVIEQQLRDQRCTRKKKRAEDVEEQRYHPILHLRPACFRVNRSQRAW